MIKTNQDTTTFILFFRTFFNMQFETLLPFEFQTTVETSNHHNRFFFSLLKKKKIEKELLLLRILPNPSPHHGRKKLPGVWGGVWTSPKISPCHHAHIAVSTSKLANNSPFYNCHIRATFSSRNAITLNLSKYNCNHIY